MPELHSLRLYLKDDYQLHFIEEINGRDKEELLTLGRERVSNNESYVPILITFKATDAMII